MVEKLLALLKNNSEEVEARSSSTILTLLNVIHALLCSSPRVTDVLCFALFTAATLKPDATSERKLGRLEEEGTGEDDGGDSFVVLRNRCLKLFFSLLYTGKKVGTA